MHHEFKAQAIINKSIIPVVMMVHVRGDDQDDLVSVRVGERVFPLIFTAESDDISGEVTWTLPNGTMRGTTITFNQLRIKGMADGIAKTITEDALVQQAASKPPSAKNFEAGSRSANAMVATSVAYAVGTITRLEIAGTLAATCAYLIVRNHIDRQEAQHPGISDPEVCELIWKRVGWVFLGTQLWSREHEWAIAVALLASHGHSVQPL